jgi:hypothetical protein
MVGPMDDAVPVFAERIMSVSCVECKRLPDAGWHLWRAYRTDDPELDEPSTIGFFCPSCSEREFGR